MQNDPGVNDTDYLQRLMARQAVLASAFDREQTIRFALYEMAEPAAPEGSETKDAKTSRQKPSAEEASDVREIYRKLMQTDVLQEKTAAIRQVAEQQKLLRQLRSESLAEQSRQQHPGGISMQVRQLMQTGGMAGRQTRQSMEEISRFFERDSRRY